MALDQIEGELQVPTPASIKSVILQAMADEPSDWQNYYRGSKELVEFFKLYSFSDRVRYYWDRRPVSLALEQLLENVSSAGLSAAMASQFGINFPIGSTKVDPRTLIAERVRTTVKRYYQAGRWIDARA